MKKKFAFIPAIAFVILLAGFTTPPSSGQKKVKTNYKAVLLAKMLPSNGKTKAKGYAAFDFSKNGKSVFYKVFCYNIDHVTMAHIHHGMFPKMGPIAVWLYKGKVTGKINGLLAKGTITNKDVNLDSLRTWIMHKDAFVLVHTQKFPNGEIGGTIH